MIVETIDYRRGAVRIIDQSALPAVERYLDLGDVDALAGAIRTMKIRGAPAIGIAAAYGVLLALERALGGDRYAFDHGEPGRPVPIPEGTDARSLERAALEAIDLLGRTRPTAVNLFWALDRMRRAISGAGEDAAALCEAASAEAFALHDGELELERRIGEHGAALIKDGARILTHCNAGGLATAGYGTALAVIYAARGQGKDVQVFADETRPLLQGARLTAWELRRAGIPVTLLCDGAAASLIASGRIDAVITGADRVAANGDSANKIGTLGLAVSCARSGVPFYIAAPWSSIDMATPDGSMIPIEERDPLEVTRIQGVDIAPQGVSVYNPAFDVTPAELITALVTETGVIRRPDEGSLAEAARRAGCSPSRKPPRNP
ncbi:MAG: S-methyl-5-thioribose-1-phosphate isomerase [Candidatus Krumholzibacteria bacterium]|nr:S-methyl-5-thioribose-1-phosphate isomerase [Candidatus Krumholzibacteria bacterium]